MGKPESLAIISPLTSCMKQYTVHSDQLAGHNGHLLKIHGGKVMKKTKKGESAFYASLMTRNLPEEIMTFFPKFYGIEILDGRYYVILEDLIQGYDKPAIIDIKIGTSSVDPHENEAKQEFMKKKDQLTTTKTLGLRICGFKVWDMVELKSKKEGKKFGNTLKADQMKDAIKHFFFDGCIVRKDVIEYLQNRLVLLMKWFELGGHFSLISSSLLIVYDAASPSVKADLRMIDFAHVLELPESEKDEKYLCGLRNLVKIFKDVLEEDTSLTTGFVH